MELLAVILMVASAAAGWAARRVVAASVGRAIAVLGAVAALGALAVLAAAVWGWGPLGAWAAGRAAVILLGVAVLTLPFGVSVSWGRTSGGSGAG